MKRDQLKLKEVGEQLCQVEGDLFNLLGVRMTTETIKQSPAVVLSGSTKILGGIKDQPMLTMLKDQKNVTLGLLVTFSPVANDIRMWLIANQLLCSEGVHGEVLWKSNARGVQGMLHKSLQAAPKKLALMCLGRIIVPHPTIIWDSVS